MTNYQWSPVQLQYAQTIVSVGKSTPGITDRDIQTALMVALDESHLQDYANSTVPESLGIKHDAVGNDSDSVGIFQQRPSQGWGSVPDLMDPSKSAQKFYDALKALPPNIRGTMPPWILAQTIQKSGTADGSNYAKYFDEANALMAAVGGGTGHGGAQVGPNNSPLKALFDPEFWKRVGIGALGALLLIIVLWKWLSAQQFVKDAVSTVKKGAALAAVAA